MWIKLLDELSLVETVRNSSNLVTWKKFPIGFPKKKELPELKNEIRNLLSNPKHLTLIDFYYDGNYYRCNSIVISCDKLEDMYKFRDLWLRLAGNYIVILPNKAIVKNFYEGTSDEEIIGKFLMTEKKLLLKTPDGYELLYLFLS